MTLSISSFKRLIFLLAALGCCLTGSSHAAPLQRIALLPVNNLSAGPLPEERLLGLFRETLQKAGVFVLPEEEMNSFLSKHRLRYTGGIDRNTAEALQSETGVEGVLVVTVHNYSETFPGRIALTLTLTTASSDPLVVQSGNAALTANDAPGLFDLGIVHDIKVLEIRAVSEAVKELFAPAATQRGRGGEDRRYAPKLLFRDSGLNFDRPLRIALLPFKNQSNRRYAGEIISTLFAAQLAKLPQVIVVDPGAARQTMLANRLIMEGGVSLDQAQTLFGDLHADLILTGRVSEFVEAGNGGVPKILFSAQLLERQTRRILWSIESRNSGSDGVYFFELGTVRNPSLLADEMIRAGLATLLPH
jgi:TolB-like protein